MSELGAFYIRSGAFSVVKAGMLMLVRMLSLLINGSFGYLIMKHRLLKLFLRRKSADRFWVFSCVIN